MKAVFVCDAIRTPIGRYGGALATVRPDDLAAHVIRTLVERSGGADWNRLDEVYFGCANQSGEDNRNVARMATLLAGLPPAVPGVTLNRLCASGMDAVGAASRAIACGEILFPIAGGVESMSRAPYVLGKAETPFARGAELSTRHWAGGLSIPRWRVYTAARQCCRLEIMSPWTTRCHARTRMRLGCGVSSGQRRHRGEGFSLRRLRRCRLRAGKRR